MARFFGTPRATLGWAVLLPLLFGAVGVGDATDVAAGQTIFRANCVRCHGADAHGFTGPDLTIAASRPDAEMRLSQIIKGGIPGTDMPASGLLSDADVARLVAYLRSLTPPAVAAEFRLPGSAIEGEQIFWGAGGCGVCHYADGRGGRLGPNLSRGMAASTAPAWDALVAAIRRPSDTIARGYSTVTVVTRDGQRIRGVRRNEDTFSIQMLDMNERLRGFLKSDLREVIEEPGSLMPAYGLEKLTDAQVDNLVRYLVSLREKATTTVGR
jgi:putative heme-binding domain-containing protein